MLESTVLPGPLILSMLQVAVWIQLSLFGVFSSLLSTTSLKVSVFCYSENANVCYELALWNPCQSRVFCFFSFSSLSDAHPQSQITRLAWLDDETLVSVGQDCNTKIWNITPF